MPAADKSEKRDRRADTIARKLGYEKAEDLLRHFPRRHEDRRKWAPLSAVAQDDPVTAKGTVVSTKSLHWGRGRVETLLQLEGTFETLKLIFINMPFRKRQFVEGKVFVVHGRLKWVKKEPVLYHPEVEEVQPGQDEMIHLDRITPIYPLVSGVKQGVLRRVIHDLVHREFELNEAFPVPEGMMERRDAFQAFHFPGSHEELRLAEERLAFEELMVMQVVLARRRAKVERIHKERPEISEDLVAPFLKALPYECTGAQKKVLGEIEEDLLEPHPMNRLLQGDVGAGKTVVATATLLMALERKQNGALLAPTETLAEQHSVNLRSWLEPLGVKVELRTRTHRGGDEASLFTTGQKGCIYVGTHALIQDSVEIPDLGMVVVDEQHKFGVLQRAALVEKGGHPDVLVMTATPIPRTMSLTMYGDLDVSILDELPAGRTPIKTVVRTRDQLPKVWEFIKKEIAEERHAYVVYPLVEESEKLDARSAEEGFDELKSIFGEKEVALLHGKMHPKKKAEVMERFRAGDSHVLVSTTVIEVGVDVSTATMMVIENAERFGLAQLHQLRGRVGRGKHTSYCVLVGETASELGWKRLKIMESTNDGFKLAEEDFKIRGPGNILGTEQSGLPSFNVAELPRHLELLQRAKEVARELVVKDPELKKFRGLREEIEVIRVARREAAN